jgi:hypothetical protein
MHEELKRAHNMPLLDIDTAASWRIYDEVDDARHDGYEVTIGDTFDQAYDHPSKISQVYEFLHEHDIRLEQDRKQVIIQGLGRLGMNPLKRDYRRERAIDIALEPLRVRRLFGPNRAIAWHEQRGRAAALLSIVSAHDLQVDQNLMTGRYATMSGPLDTRVLDYTFGQNAPRLVGVSIEETLIDAEKRHGGHAEVKAKQRASMRLKKMEEFVLSPVSPVFKDVVQYSADALGIRSRKAEVHQAIRHHLVDAMHGAGGREYLMMSFGCGTALPMLEVIQDLKTHYDVHGRLILLDQDPLALASAACLAEDMGVGDAVEIHCERLFGRFGAPIKLQSILKGRQLDIAEDSGLREYLPDAIYRSLTRETWRNLRSGGLMTTGNMNINRPHAEFLHGMMGWWPKVQMRTIAEGARLHREAGIPQRATRMRVTRDGVYTMYFTEKQ